MTLVSYAALLFSVLAIAVLITSVATTLLHVCEWIEEHPKVAHKSASVLHLGTFLTAAALTISDDLPWTFLLWISIAQAFIHLVTAHPLHISVGRILVVCLIPILPHLTLMHHFRQTVPQHGSTDSLLHTEYLNKPRLPGGRLDWDAYAATNSSASHAFSSTEQLVCFTLCWMSTIWTLLCSISQSGALPFYHHSGATRSRNKSSL